MSETRPEYHYGRQDVCEGDIAAVVAALRTDMISQGAILPDFEERVADYCGAKYCLAVNSGTAALHLATQALQLGKGDVGWTSAMSFVASANVIRYTGADVDFLDISPDDFNVTAETFAEKLGRAEQQGRLPRVIIPVHFAGQSCNMEAIAEVAARYNVSIIEDACQAMGGDYDGGRVGNCQYSDAVCFSLHPVKSITAGEGGLVLTNNKDLYKRMALLRTHGVAKGADVEREVGPWHTEMQTEGYNYRITEFQCALARSQLNRLDEFITKRRSLAARYRERLTKLNNLRLQNVPSPNEHAWHMMLVLFDFDALGKSKLDVHSEFRKRGINLNMHYYPIPLNPLYRDLYGFSDGDFPNAEQYWRDAFTFPLHTNLETTDVDFICDCVEEIIT